MTELSEARARAVEARDEARNHVEKFPISEGDAVRVARLADVIDALLAAPAPVEGDEREALTRSAAPPPPTEKQAVESHLRGRWSNGDPVHIVTDGVERWVAPNHNGAEWIPEEAPKPYDRYAEHDRVQREGGTCSCGETFLAPADAETPTEEDVERPYDEATDHQYAAWETDDMEEHAHDMLAVVRHRRAALSAVHPEVTR